MENLWHQCDYCPAATATAPHLANLARSANNARRSHLIACIALIEIARQQRLENCERFDKTADDDTPTDLRDAYDQTIASVSDIVSNCHDDLSDGDARRLAGSLMVFAGLWKTGWKMIVDADGNTG